MSKPPIAALASAALAMVALAMPATANSPCRTNGPGSCSQALARATTGRVNTVYRTVYVQQVRDVVRVRNVYRDRVVHVARPAPQPVVVQVVPMAPQRVMNYGVIQSGVTHPHGMPGRVPPCNCAGSQHIGTQHAGYYYHQGYYYPYR